MEGSEGAAENPPPVGGACVCLPLRQRCVKKHTMTVHASSVTMSTACMPCAVSNADIDLSSILYALCIYNRIGSDRGNPLSRIICVEIYRRINLQWRFSIQGLDFHALLYDAMHGRSLLVLHMHEHPTRW